MLVPLSETVPERLRQVPFTEKQPAAMLMPLADVVVPLVILSAVVLMPPPKVEVAVAFEVMTPVLEMEKSVEVETPEEEAMLKMRLPGYVVPLLAEIANAPNGDEVPIPTLLAK